MKYRYVRCGKITDFNELFDLSARKQPVIWVTGLVHHEFVEALPLSSYNGPLQN